ncbi:alkylation response protein AidB-like acyl-CoA dehydrogenase [Streptomyces canus]|uniref:Alkylation response protein AidB-like acyl-CoA dehydrogenase n=1 Tax=Streptomyces canus TaxID=58343 RepID=A0AAW8FI37_9ACTN|nr:alkylation response protein AidB-like acyl-CoA dehydrogenase [Streptomyces canus]
MDARFTAEQDEIRRAVRELLRRRCGPEESRSAVDTPAGYDPALWTALAEQLGLPGLALPETYGGVGCSVTELALACEETGRVLAATPLLGTAVLVAPLVLALGTEEQRAGLLPRMASGALTAALAVPPGAALGLTGDNGAEWAGGGRAGGVQARRSGGAGGGVVGGPRAAGAAHSGPGGAPAAGPSAAMKWVEPPVAGPRSAGAALGGPGGASTAGPSAAMKWVEPPVAGPRSAGAALGGPGAARAPRPSAVTEGAGAPVSPQLSRATEGAGLPVAPRSSRSAAAPSASQPTHLARSRPGDQPHAPGWRLYGEVDQVLDGHSADLLLVAAHAGGFARSRTLLFLVPGDAAGLVRTRQRALDATRPRARVQLRDVEAELLGDEDGADVLGALARTGDTAATVLACEAVGAADRVLEMTVEYVKQREQFGRPVGSFQAVKHRLADVYVQLQAARSAAYFAAWAAVHDERRVGGLALAQALEALRTAAAEGIQLHGGIGFTWEHEAQLYFKRATGDELLFGPAHRLRAHAADAARLFERAEVSV